jgi:hypothetical protein
MPGFIVHQGASVLCAHAGLAQPTSVNPNVLVGGMPIVAVTNAYAIAGCTLALTAGSPFCTTGTWLSGSTRVLAGGQPVVILSSTSTCIATGTPMQILSTQTQVSAT